MKPKTRDLLKMAISDGILMGVNRAFKHTDKPDIKHIIDQVDMEVWLAIDSWFEFDEVKE